MLDVGITRIKDPPIRVNPEYKIWIAIGELLNRLAPAGVLLSQKGKTKCRLLARN
jgi:hypothetical protein